MFTFLTAALALLAPDKQFELQPQAGHPGRIDNVVYSPDYRVFATSGADETLLVWDATTGKLLWKYHLSVGSEQSQVQAAGLAFSHDGTRLFVAEGYALNMLDVGSGKTLGGFTVAAVSTRALDKLRVSDDGKFVFAGMSHDGLIYAYDWRANRVVIQEATPGSAFMDQVLLGGDGSHFFVWQRWCEPGYWRKRTSSTLLEFDATTGKRVRAVDLGPLDYPSHAALGPDGTTLALELPKELYPEPKNRNDPLTGNQWLYASDEKVTRAFSASTVTPLPPSTSVAFIDAAAADGPSLRQRWFRHSNPSDVSRAPTALKTTLAAIKAERRYVSHAGITTAVKFSPDGRFLAVSSRPPLSLSVTGEATIAEPTMRIWDAKSGALLRSLSVGGYGVGPDAVRYSGDGKWLVVNYGDAIEVHDPHTGRRMGRYDALKVARNSSSIDAIAVNPKRPELTVVETLLNLPNKRLGEYGQQTVRRVFNLSLPDLKRGKTLIDNQRAHLYSSAAYSSAGDVLVLGNDALHFIDPKSGKEQRALPVLSDPESARQLAFSADDARVTFVPGGIPFTIEPYVPPKSPKLYNAGYNCGAMSPDGKLFAFDFKSDITIVDTETNQLFAKLTGHSAHILGLAFSPDGKHLASASNDGTVRIWTTDGKSWVMLMNHGDEWLTVDNEGFFDASLHGGDQVAMVRGNEFASIEQFAVRNNRPDKIAAKLGETDPAVLRHYRRLFDKRLAKLGLSEAQLSADQHLPTVKLKASMTANPGKEGTATLEIEAKDDSVPLRSYQVFVGGVPIFGATGKALSGHTAKLTESFPLGAGVNRIEVSVINQLGAESIRAFATLADDRRPRRELYFLGFGVSKYARPELQLGFADKDARDLSQAFARMEPEFAKVHVKTLLNAEVTTDSIRAAKDFVKDARVDDVFVLFIAGHGVYEQTNKDTYYYLTADADPMALAETAANFELIEDLLQGIAPRQKLFLMDTCESGESESGGEQATQPAMIAATKVARGLKRQAQACSGETCSAARFAFQRDRFSYNDLVRRSGAVVFSSSRGGERSWEDQALKNGLFTRAVLDALSKKKADRSGDGRVDLGELKAFVIDEVARTSAGQQHPTIDRDNLSLQLDFSLQPSK